jgi:hypothetical protein
MIYLLWRRPSLHPRSGDLAMAGAGAAAAIILGQSVLAAWRLLDLPPPDGARVSLLSLWRSGAPAAVVTFAVAAVAYARRDKPITVPLAGAVLAATAALTLALWDDRQPAERRLETGRRDAALEAAIGPEPGPLLWVGGDAQPWLLTRRGAWATSIQGASVVFSRPLAMTWDERMRRIIALGFSTQADRSPFTPAKRFAKGLAREGAITVCNWPDAPAAILIAGRRPIPRSTVWSPNPVELRLTYDGKRFQWLRVIDYTVVRCSALKGLRATLPATPEAGRPTA